jgi:hypothetical protein
MRRQYVNEAEALIEEFETCPRWALIGTFDIKSAVRHH